MQPINKSPHSEDRISTHSISKNNEQGDPQTENRLNDEVLTIHNLQQFISQRQSTVPDFDPNEMIIHPQKNISKIPPSIRRPEDCPPEDCPKDPPRVQQRSSGSKRPYRKKITGIDLPLKGPIAITGFRRDSVEHIPFCPSSTNSIPLHQQLHNIIEFLEWIHENTTESKRSFKNKIHLPILDRIAQELPPILTNLDEISQKLSLSSSASSDYQSISNQLKSINYLFHNMQILLDCLREERTAVGELRADCQKKFISSMNEAFESINFIKMSFGLESTQSLGNPISSSHTINPLPTSSMQIDGTTEVNLIEANHAKKRKLDTSNTIHYCALEILNVFKDMFNNSESADLVFQVEDEEFYAHRAFLYHRSPIFKQMDLGNFTETHKKHRIKIDQFSKETFKTILNFIYTAEVNSLHLENVLSIYRAANHYGLNELQILCKNYLTKNLSAENGIAILIRADDEKIDCIYQETLEFVLENAQTIFHQDSTDFLKLPIHLFLNILQSDDFNLPEVKIMHVAVRWLEAQESLIHLADVKKNIRFTCMALPDIWSIVRQAQVKGEAFCTPDELSIISERIASKKDLETSRKLK